MTTDDKVKVEEEDIYNLKAYPRHLRPIVEVIMGFESRLSDGFEWYGDVEAITALANNLYKLHNKKKDT